MLMQHSGFFICAISSNSEFIQNLIVPYRVNLRYCMKIHMGMLIWKEMNAQGISQSKLVKLLKDRNIPFNDLFKSEYVDVDVLIHVSDILNKNFFASYEPSQLPDALKIRKLDSLKEKLEEHKLIIQKQERLISAQQKNINSQDSLIIALRRKWNDD